MRTPVVLAAGSLVLAAALAIAMRGSGEHDAKKERPTSESVAEQAPSSAAPSITLPLVAPPAPSSPSSPSIAEPPNANANATSLVAADPALALVRAAKSDPSERGTSALIAALTSSDAVVVIEAADGLVARRATRATRDLAKIDIRKDANIAPAVIDSLGKLGGLASGDEREAAVDRLLALLTQEKSRGAPESIANLLQIYEALGDTRHAKAAPALEAELADPNVARAAKNTIVVALGRIGAPSSRAALAQLERESSAPQADAFEEQLRKELLAAITAALRAIP